MKTGRTLTEMGAEIQRQQKTKRDFVAPTKRLKFAVVGTNGGRRVDLRMDRGDEVELFGTIDHFHGQVGDRLKIPAKYYRRMQADAPELLATNVNHWFETSGENRMVRTLDGEARAFLSNRFRPMDNFDLAEAVLPILMNTPGLRVESCEITPRRMYIKAVNEKLEAKIQRGNHTFLKAGEQDVVQAGVAISNSEIGAGALRIEPLVFRLVCWNGAIMLDQSIRKFHSGRRQTGGEDGAWEVFSEATKNLSDAALWSQVRDLTKAALEEALFLQNVAKIQAAAGERIEADPVKVVEVLQRKLDLTETEGGGILRRLVEGGDLSKWGLANALTLHSQEIEDYDRATDFERFGGQVVEMDKKSWKEIVEAAA